MPAVSQIKQEDFIQSVADALQYISYYHPVDYIRNLAAAYEREESPAAKDAIAQILTNSRMSAEGHRPICQDTGIVNVFVKVGMDVPLTIHRRDGTSEKIVLTCRIDTAEEVEYFNLVLLKLEENRYSS